MHTITGTVDISGIKRCYIEGVVLKADCPKCGEEVSTDLGDNYLSYPKVGVEDTVGLYCDECYEDLEVRIKVREVKVTIDILGEV